jgi:ribosome-associated protein
VIEKLADRGTKGKRVEGREESVWVLLDYGDVVVHIFAPEQREFYRLEAYWTGAEKGSPPPLAPEETR